MNITNDDIGARIRKIREVRGYTREKLAEYADISAEFLWEVETGRKGIKAQNLGKLAEALSISADYLLFGKSSFQENENIHSMIAALPEEIQQQIGKMITVFIDTVRISTKNNLESNFTDDKQGD